MEFQRTQVYGNLWYETETEYRLEYEDIDLRDMKKLEAKDKKSLSVTDVKAMVPQPIKKMIKKVIR